MSRAPELTAEEFFKKAQPHSKVKADIVSSYIISWANIIIRSKISWNKKLESEGKPCKDTRAYVIDLFAGAGKYDDGYRSTPLKVIDAAIAQQHLRENLILRFNDESKEMITRLRLNIDETEGFDSFKNPIQCSSLDADSEEIKGKFMANANGPKLPMLVFIDPFGYKQISQELLRSIIKVPQSDILFFFNYKRVNAALGNQDFESNMDRIFGPNRVKVIKDELSSCKQGERQDIIMRHLTESLKEIGANFVTSYVVVPEEEEAVSHYIVGITKHEKGFELFKKIMDQHSKIGLSAKSKFGHDLSSIARDRQQSLFDAPPDPVGDLCAILKDYFAHETVTFQKLYKTHHPLANYTEKEYKTAIRQLIAKNEVTILVGGEKKNLRTLKGLPVIPDYLEIVFK